MRLALRGCLRPFCYYRQSHLRIKKHLINALHIYKMFLQLVIYYYCYYLKNKSKFAIHLLSQHFEHEYDPVQLNEAV